MNNFGFLMVAVIAGVVLWYVLRRKQPTSATRRSARVDDTRILFHCAVSGESFYQDNIRQVVVAGTAADPVPEPANPHDKNAVRVDVDGLTVGYIPRDQAKEAKRNEWKAIIAAVNSGSKATGIVLGLIETYRQKR